MSQINVSIGVVRVANINPCVELSNFLMEADWPEGVDVRVMAYHSRQVLLLRHEQEKYLDALLNRSEPQKIFEDSIIRNHLNNATVKNIIFIVVATPVEEVGRDHDFDWAVIEPSSYRSFIQMSGRILRHRLYEVKAPNIAIMQYNLNGFIQKDISKVVFTKPGFEDSFPSSYKLISHRVDELLDLGEISSGVTAIPRLMKNKILNPKSSLIDLEHFTMQETLTQYHLVGPETMQGWLTQCWWMTAHSQKLNEFRKQEGSPQIKLKRIIDYKFNLSFREEGAQKGVYDIEFCGLKINEKDISSKVAARLWLDRDYFRSISVLSDEPDRSKEETVQYLSHKYGEIILPAPSNATADTITNVTEKWFYNDNFGLWELSEEE